MKLLENYTVFEILKKNNKIDDNVNGMLFHLGISRCTIKEIMGLCNISICKKSEKEIVQDILKVLELCDLMNPNQDKELYVKLSSYGNKTSISRYQDDIVLEYEDEIYSFDLLEEQLQKHGGYKKLLQKH